MICLMPKLIQSFFVYYMQSKEKEIFKVKKEWRIEQKNEKKAFGLFSQWQLRKTSQRQLSKHANELKFHKKLWVQQLNNI